MTTEMTENLYLLDLAASIDRYKDLGFSFIPIIPPSIEGADGKRPALSTWDAYTKRHPMEEEIDKWFLSNNLACNIAVVTGWISNIAVVDIDDELSYEQIKPWLPDTMTVKTGKGYHLYYRPDEKSKMGRTVQFILNDKVHHIKRDNSYVIAPPSLHKSGKRYSCINADLPVKINMDELYALIQRSGAMLGHVSTNARSSDWASQLCSPQGEGSRNNSAAQLCGLLIRYFKHDPGLIMGLMIAWNNQYCTPPLSDAEIKYLVDSEYRRYKDK
jgi:hypothetical protein